MQVFARERAAKLQDLVLEVHCTRQAADEALILCSGDYDRALLVVRSAGPGAISKNIPEILSPEPRALSPEPLRPADALPTLQLLDIMVRTWDTMPTLTLGTKWQLTWVEYFAFQP